MKRCVALAPAYPPLSGDPCTAAPLLDRLTGLVVCIIFIGFFTGFYIVPLFTLLQHRAPKTSKGDSIATSNFINVTGATAATLLFYVLVFGAQRIGLADAQVRIGIDDVDRRQPCAMGAREGDGGAGGLVAGGGAVGGQQDVLEHGSLRTC